ncbi:DUF7095 family protein [Natronobiforma cellulositropha]|uniref:DUF7095 family protein n=1 Tax=Natronobiforma cellulositropha TaxID=1679076 RepID=UPI0021D57BF1|nr:hypothetical protein [Natronobiforma cellulositropha]
MTGLERDRAVSIVERVVEAVDTERMPVPVREVWAFGDVALGLDPVERLDIYLTKDVLLRDDTPAGREDAAERFLESHGVRGVGKSVRADWADANPEFLRSNPNGYAAPEKCLAAHLFERAAVADAPVHLEVCNASFEDNVTQRLRGAQLREDYTQLLDPRGACLWVDGVRSDEAFAKLREGSFVLPTLADALVMLGMDEEEADRATADVQAWRTDQEGASVRGDVV